MYLVAVIFIGVLVLVTLYLDHNRKRRRIKRWFASQPREVIISGRKRVAERARALLQEQIDCHAVMKEFGQSQDPEIQKFIAIIAEVLQEGEEYDFPDWFKDSIKKQILVLEKRTEEQEKLEKWLNQLLDYGFRGIVFPIAIVNNSSKGLNIILTLEEYAFDPDLYFWPFLTDSILIDSKGVQYSLRYHEELQFSYPNEKVAELDLNKVKQLLKQRLRKKKLVQIIESSNTIEELYHRLHQTNRN